MWNTAGPAGRATGTLAFGCREALGLPFPHRTCTCMAASEGSLLGPIGAVCLCVGRVARQGTMSMLEPDVGGNVP